MIKIQKFHFLNKILCEIRKKRQCIVLCIFEYVKSKLIQINRKNVNKNNNSCYSNQYFFTNSINRLNFNIKIR